MIHDLEVSLEEERRIQRLKNQRAIALLDRMLADEEGDEEEQRETFEVIKKGVNENHTSDRIIFP